MPKLKEKRFTKIIIDATKITTYEYDSDKILLECFLGSESGPGNALFKKFSIPLKRKNQFEYEGTGQIIIDDVLIGSYLWIRTKVVKKNGEESLWSEWTKEVAGDTLNELQFSAPTVTMTSTAVTFSVAISNIPKDFEEFAWKYSTETANLLDGPGDEPSQPNYPDIDAMPDIKTTSLDDVSISFNKDRTTWFHVWVRAIDSSGNYAPNDIATNYWYYIGVGKVLAQSGTADIDNIPPDDSTIETLEE